MKIPIYKLEFDNEFIEKYKNGAEEILRSDSLSEGPWVRKFEKRFSNLINCKHAIAVTSGTAALEIALKSVGADGKEVLLPSNTFFATSVAVTNAGGIIKLVDIEPDNFSLCPSDLRYKLHAGVGAVIVVHIGGIISKHIKEIKKACDEYNIPLIEDAAHAHCSSFDGLHAGTIGDIGCFSFFPTKVMTTGEGGMITTNIDTIADTARSLKNFGRDNNNSALCIHPHGQNSKINEFTGLIGALECERVISRIEKRNTLLKRYIKNLKNSSFNVITQEKGFCSYYKCILKTSIDREFLKEFCKKNGISLTGDVYSIPVHNQPLYKFANIKDLPKTDEICSSHICPPLYPELTLDEIDYICKILLLAEKESK